MSSKVEQIKLSRLEFLAKKFNVVDDDELNGLVTEYGDALIDPINPFNKVIEPIFNQNRSGINEAKIIAIIKQTASEKTGRVFKDVYISLNVFSDIIAADPTENKSNVQWLLQTFTHLIKEDREDGIRFVTEDLPTANTYLTLFEGNKLKKRFIEWGKKSEFRRWGLLIDNKGKGYEEWELLKYTPSDITQYKSLAQLFDAIDPFRVRSHSDLEDAMQRFINLGEAELEYRDRFWTIYSPLTKSASGIMESFAGWCTADSRQGMFDHYVQQKQPNGKNSKLYIIINNDVFDGKSDEVYQAHFESGQVKDKSNGGDVDLYDLVFEKEHGDGIHEFFHAELDFLARSVNNVQNNKYIDYLVSYGFSESLFDYLNPDTDTISMDNKKIPKLPDISRFKKLEQLIIINCNLKEIDFTTFDITLLTLPGNQLTTLPKSIGKLKNVDVLNLSGNPLETVPNELGEMDTSKGGKLVLLTLNFETISEEVLKRIKKLLPTTIIVDGDFKY